MTATINSAGPSAVDPLPAFDGSDFPQPPLTITAARINPWKSRAIPSRIRNSL